jgi:hypothetical protein
LENILKGKLYTLNYPPYWYESMIIHSDEEAGALNGLNFVLT